MASKKQVGVEDLLILANQKRDQIHQLLEEYRNEPWDEAAEDLEKEIAKISRSHERLTKEIKNRFESILSGSSHYVKDDEPNWVLREFGQN